MPNKTLIIPVEIKSRDLYGRLYFAQAAAQRGYRVLIGYSGTLHKQLPRFPRGIIYEDDITFQARHFIQQATDMGYGIVTNDEESIAVTTDKRYVMQRVHYPNLKMVLTHFTRGQHDRQEILERAPAHQGLCPMVPAGNPRLDLLQEKLFSHYENNAPHDWEPDDVILVNSRFSRSNPFNMTRDKVRDVVRRKFNFTEEEFKDYAGYLDHTDALFDHFVPAVEKLPEIFPDKIIVYRPHPAENFAFWQNIADKYDNAHCLHSGTATQWSTNARAVIHTGCTTAIESALLGSNVLSYCPIESNEYDVKLANISGKICRTEQELFESIRSLTAPNNEQKIANAAQARKHLSQHIAGLDRQTATEIRLDTIEKLDWNPPAASIGRIGKDVIWMLRYYKNALFTKKSNASKAYKTQKFPPTKSQEIATILKDFGGESLKLHQYSHEWWEIKK